MYIPLITANTILYKQSLYAFWFALNFLANGYYYSYFLQMLKIRTQCLQISKYDRGMYRIQCQGWQDPNTCYKPKLEKQFWSLFKMSQKGLHISERSSSQTHRSNTVGLTISVHDCSHWSVIVKQLMSQQYQKTWQAASALNLRDTYTLVCLCTE